MFDFEKVEDFDSHIAMSIPDYNGLAELVETVALEYLHPEGNLLDIGCSSGRLISSLAKRTPASLIGCDVVDIRADNKIPFYLCKASEAISLLNEVDVITSIFSLQFMSPSEREKTLWNIGEKVKNGSVAIIAEKIRLGDARVDSVVSRHLHKLKLKNFTPTEILKKDDELFGSMFSVNSDQMKSELAEIGNATQIWQSCGFAAWVVTK